MQAEPSALEAAALLRYLPAAQAVHPEVPVLSPCWAAVGWNRPLSHTSQASVSAADASSLPSRYLPAAQAMQLVSPVVLGWYLPEGHASHVSVLAFSN